MKTFLRVMKYLMYGVFALLFMMSWAFLGQGPEWMILVFNVPALLYLAAQLLFAIFKSRSAWAITMLLIAISCLEVMLVEMGAAWSPVAPHLILPYHFVRFSYSRLKNVKFYAIDDEHEIGSGPDVGCTGPAVSDPSRQYH